MSIVSYAGWPAYDTFLIVSLSGRPVYDPNLLRPNPNPKKPVSGSCRVRGLSRTLTPLLCDMFSLSFIIKIVYNPFTRNEVLTLSSFLFSFLFLVNWIDKHKKKNYKVMALPTINGTQSIKPDLFNNTIWEIKKRNKILLHISTLLGQFISTSISLSKAVLDLVVWNFAEKHPIVINRGGKWVGWVINGLSHKWVGCIITHLSIYDPLIYKLIIHYLSNPFN